MSELRWFRMYSEFATDPVVQSLSFDDQRHFVVILCLKSSGVLDKEFGHPQIRNDVIRKTLGLDGVAFQEARSRLCGSRLINGDWQPTNWDKRQFISDSDPTAAERKRRQREREHVTDVSRVSHVPQRQIQNQITETEKKEEERLGPPAGLNREAFERYVDYLGSLGKPMAPASILAAQRKLAAFGDKQSEVVEQTVANGWKGLFHLAKHRDEKPKRTWRPGPEDSGPC